MQKCHRFSRDINAGYLMIYLLYLASPLVYTNVGTYLVYNFEVLYPLPHLILEANFTIIPRHLFDN